MKTLDDMVGSLSLARVDKIATRKKQLITEEQLSDIEKMKAENKKLKSILRHLFPDKCPNTYFICGASGDQNDMGLPDAILICPAYGSDLVYIYKKVRQ